MINAFATIGALALVFGFVFLLYFGLRRVIQPAPADAARATLAQMAEWMPPGQMRDPNDGGDIVIGNEKLVGLEGGGQPCNPDYDAILEYNDEK